MEPGLSDIATIPSEPPSSLPEVNRAVEPGLSNIAIISSEPGSFVPEVNHFVAQITHQINGPSQKHTQNRRVRI